MNNWSEANFLERLMSPSSQQRTEKKSSCPDSELLTAFSENQVEGFVSDAIAAHLTQCPECADLHHRLLCLVNVDLEAVPTEWRNAEKRLDNWMHTYLNAYPNASIESEARAKQEVSIADRRTAWKISSWNIRWALGAVAVLALAAATTFFLKQIFPSPAGQTEVAMKTAPPSAAPASSASGQRESQAASENSSATGTAQPKEENPVKNHTSTTKARPPAVPAPLNSAPTALQQSETESARDTRALAKSPTSGSATPSAGDKSLPSGAESNQATATHRPSVSVSNGFVPVAKSAVPTAANVPASIALEYNTSTWIQLTSDSPPEDGNFHFWGTVFKPIESASATMPLDANTEVDGIGAVNYGQISLVIKEFFFRGARYTLKSGNGSARAEAFDDGRILEIWSDEDSIYARVPYGLTVAGPRPPSTAFTAISPRSKSTAARAATAPSPHK
jgi:hypothetical protein